MPKKKTHKVSVVKYPKPRGGFSVKVDGQFRIRKDTKAAALREAKMYRDYYRKYG